MKKAEAVRVRFHCPECGKIQYIKPEALNREFITVEGESLLEIKDIYTYPCIYCHEELLIMGEPMED